MPSLRPSPVLALLPILAACSSSPFSSHLLEDDRACPVDMETGELLTLHLPTNPSTGYRWNLREYSEELLEVRENGTYRPDPRHPIGGAGSTVWSFEALEEGTARLLLTYQQPWEMGAEPAGLFDCRIEID